MPKAYVLINVDTAYTSQVMERINGLAGIGEVHEVLGPFDVVAEVETSGMQDLIVVLRDEIRVIPGVKNTVTCITVD
ncbi:Lrp/AsnC family transcriptional regulator [SAR202 cluster bacterium AD-804-J14_MRT_500m]|nr:Lrp/AsnC family transcriptional regulator [SAR202 cluster bacterium AD-804-J14_MRT_500m]